MTRKQLETFIKHLDDGSEACHQLCRRSLAGSSTGVAALAAHYVLGALVTAAKETLKETDDD
jgi:hypothetical protein